MLADLKEAENRQLRFASANAVLEGVQHLGKSLLSDYFSKLGLSTFL